MRNTPLVETLTETERARVEELVAHWMPWLRQEAAVQARHESGGIAALSLAEMMDAEACSPPSIGIDHERQYRRGYRHGYGQAMDDLLHAGGKRSRAWDRLAVFHDSLLYAWTIARTADMDPPPPFATWLRWSDSELRS